MLKITILLIGSLIIVANSASAWQNLSCDSLSGWSTWGSATSVEIKDGQFEGSGCIKAACTNNNSGGIYQVSSVTVNHNYTITAYVKNNAGTATGQGIGVDKEGGTAWSGVDVSQIDPQGTTSWKQYSCQITNSGSSMSIFGFFQSWSGEVKFDAFAVTDNGVSGPTYTPTKTSTPTNTFPPGVPTNTNTPYTGPTYTPPPTPSLPLWGLVHVSGENVGVPGFQHDDYGPLPQVIANLYKHSRATAMLCGDGGNWIFAEPTDPGSGPSNYDWRLCDACTDPFILPGKLAIANYFFMTPSWITYDTTRYWELQERYTRAWLSRMNQKGIYYFIFENEPNMLSRPDKLQYYMSRLQRFYPIAKSVNPNNKVIAGNLSENAAETGGAWDQLYDLGIKNYSDIIGYHPYSNIASSGINMDDCKKLHALMVRRGDGSKKLFFGEGWGPKRNVPGIGRGSHGDPYNRSEVDNMRSFMVNGYNNLNRYTGDWDPAWLFGALFFTMNDNYGAFHWKDRAVPHYNEYGQQDGYTIDGYFVGWNIDPSFFNGGLIDFNGQSKSSLLWEFPNGSAIATPQPSPIPNIFGSNLVVNGDFEGGFTSGVANGWVRWDNTLTGIWQQSSSTKHGGSYAQKFGEDDIGFNGGIKQAVTVQPGHWYVVEAYMTFEQTNNNNPDTFLRACYDLTGQTSNERALSTFWSPDFTFNITAGQWYNWKEVFKATGDKVSIWFHAGQEWASPIYFGVVDDVSLKECDAPSWANATSTPIVQPTKTNTPQPTKTNTPTNPIDTQKPCKIGDANCDTTVTPGDALIIFQMYLQVYAPTGNEPCNVNCAADTNSDSQVTPGDALCAFKIYMEMPC